jgi:hypothetical protein
VQTHSYRGTLTHPRKRLKPMAMHHRTDGDGQTEPHQRITGEMHRPTDGQTNRQMAVRPRTHTMFSVDRQTNKLQGSPESRGEERTMAPAPNGSLFSGAGDARLNSFSRSIGLASPAAATSAGGCGCRAATASGSAEQVQCLGKAHCAAATTRPGRIAACLVPPQWGRQLPVIRLGAVSLALAQPCRGAFPRIVPFPTSYSIHY